MGCQVSNRRDKGSKYKAGAVNAQIPRRGPWPPLRTMSACG
jgi:hypothetical protein